MPDQDISHTFESQTLRQVINNATDFFVKTPVESFPPKYKFSGGGVYALYYLGDFELYKGVSLTECEIQEDSIPIYIGKAVPEGWRTARAEKTSKSCLYNRIRQHYNGIKRVDNLSELHFKCRYMVLDDDQSGIIGPVEASLIRKFQPLWNQIIDGFGNHDPGKGRYDQAKSGWDVLHPGRGWAVKCKGMPPTYDNLIAKINHHINIRMKK